MKNRKGFTLIEILVVVTIIIILAGILIGVGSAAKNNAAARSTKATLKALDGFIRDYMGSNRDPDDSTVTGYFVNSSMSVTTPVSDSTRWVKLLMAFPETAKSVANLPNKQIPDPDSPASTTAAITDGWGTEIRWVPYNVTTKKEGYFWSAGPDHAFGTNDDVFSTDPM